ncbi:MAG: type I DNA topoisomerase [Actinobacteria bacterium]|nr:type I DNA topoisomerase [Actinomycetota bacterium]
MAENLVIVESPAKAKTIERYLGDRFQVLASYGHIRDLPKSNFAIEVEDGGGCHLVYEVPGNSAKHVAALRKAAKDATTVWLAPDLDREGEAIAWHVAEVLDLDLETTNRVTFDEITKDAILAAFERPRRLNTALVDAQQARRAVDRIVGYRLSPVLWRTVASGISAGRVQSVALRIIVDREDEIRAFVPQEYWDFAGAFAREGDATPTIDAKLHGVGDKRLATPKDLDKKEADEKALEKLLLVDSEAAATELRARAEALDYRVAEVRRSETRRNPKPPFTTSTLQQDAANKLGFSARQTMAVAQQLYEGVRLGSGEQEGLITYMRTDSVNLSDTALRDINALVSEKYGQRFTIDSPRAYRSKAKGAQEAHEAIRPTVVGRTPQAVRKHLKDDQFKLYDLIWKRTVATQMAQAIFDRVSADVVGTEPDGTDLTFRVTGQVLKFEGYLKVYREWRDEDEDGDDETSELPDLEEGQVLDLRELTSEQHFTNPPPRYTEATLVKTLEAEGIGRPSTYASIIGTIAARDYVRIESRRFFPTPLGEVVVSFMKAHFSEVVDLDFTARMESTLDEIAEGEEAWCSTVTRFLDEVDHWVKERKPERPRLPLHHPADCPECSAPMERVFSGKSKQWFASCSRWPDCQGTLPLNDDGTVGEPEPEPDPDPNVLCLECGQPMLLRSGKFGQFYGCPDYPKCKGIRNLSQRAVHLDGDEWKPFISPTDGKSHMELRTSRYGKPFVGSAGYPDDQFAIWSVPIADPCPECGAPLRPPPRNRKVPTAICTHPEIEHHFELDSFDQPSVHTIDVVPGVEAYDPAVGGEPLSGWPEPYEPIAMTFLEAKKPAPKKQAAKKKTAKTSTKKASARKKTAKKASKKSS